jgi:hypothetical protein
MLLALAVTPATSFAQNKKDSLKIAATTHWINDQDYTFKAQTTTPLSGRLRQLTTEYSVQVSKDMVISQLPYFGRAYSAPLNPSDAGIQFISKDFEYHSTPRKKGGWDITIKFKDAKDVQLMQLTVFNNGTANLQVISNSRQSINFGGYVTATEKK